MWARRIWIFFMELRIVFFRSLMYCNLPGSDVRNFHFINTIFGFRGFIFESYFANCYPFLNIWRTKVRFWIPSRDKLNNMDAGEDRAGGAEGRDAGEHHAGAWGEVRRHSCIWCQGEKTTLPLSPLPRMHVTLLYCKVNILTLLTYDQGYPTNPLPPARAKGGNIDKSYLGDKIF